MKNLTKTEKKFCLTLGCIFIAVFGFSQNIDFTPSNLSVCGENDIVMINAQGESITWSFATPINAYIDNAASIPYSNQHTNTIYLKPSLSQLESETFIIYATNTLSNGSTVSQTISVSNNTRIWNGGSSTDWNNPANWIPFGVPTASNSVIISGNTIISGTNYHAYSKNITVKSTGSFEILPDNNIIITDWIHVDENGSFKVRNNANLIQINNISNSGIVSIEKVTQPMNYYDYTYWSSPLTLSSGFTLKNLSPQTAIDHWNYMPTISGGSGNWVNISSHTVMDPAKGYIVKAPDTFSNSPTEKVPYTANFIGTPNNGTIYAPISKGTNANIGGTVTDEDDEWNLIGNPYPSGIDANKFLDLNENSSIIDGTIYIWTQITQPTVSVQDPFYGDYVLNYTIKDYASYNKTGGTGTASSAINKTTTPTGYIALGQSFFVKAASTLPNGSTANATFDNHMRIPEVTNNSKTALAEEKHRIWLNLTNNSGAFSQTLVGYITGATEGFDRGYDGESFGGNNVTFYSIIPDANLTIQGRALPFDANDIVTLGYNAAKKGTYSIRIDHLDGIFNNQSIFLEDKLLNIVQDLKQKPYVFSTAIGTFNNRFVLKYSSNNNKTLGVDDNNINPDSITISYAKNNNELFIVNNNTLDFSLEKVTLFNMLGQSVSNWKIENPNQQSIIIQTKPLSSGIYITKIKTSDGELSKKIIVN